MSALRSRSARFALIATLVGTLALTACAPRSGADDLGLTPTPAPSEVAPTTAPAASTCTDVKGQVEPSYSPDSIPAGSTVAAIRESGVLRVGVSADTLLMGSRNPLTGQIEGFDIDVLHQISSAIFGDPNRLQFVVLTSAQRLPALTPDASGKTQVDIVARALTINCARWQSIAFSTEYYAAGQKVLVPSDSPATRIEDLQSENAKTGEKNKVCAPAGTTTLTKLGDYPGIEPVSASTHTECLVLFQQGKVDAITGDDTILAGFAAQDPYAKVVGPAFSSEPYGLGMPAASLDLVSFVNGVLDRMRADGTWTSIYNKWLSVLGPAPAPPAAVYGR
ncbi:glutamate ABC transporter substrate-binding protein [Agreia sp. COWG]|uniref:glutamate ABC transporter substrate-binding protein n=1 Tax=Agreia sp. COWG TaxID=2773266 RepID=UPI0019288DE6|nr:glutamate ABC transporter substrate-binding protein [Agreia sp. COWG]CAD5994260.1 Amino acid ABC transporter substrate-binding protein, PAAT family [Agreia sp. COWG]